MLMCAARARKILIENGKAYGVEALMGDDVVEFHAHKEVIVSASPINSPKLLCCPVSVPPSI